jgi:hypothetical protein
MAAIKTGTSEPARDEPNNLTMKYEYLLSVKKGTFYYIASGSLPRQGVYASCICGKWTAVKT